MDEKYDDNRLLNITFDCVKGVFLTKSRDLPKLRNCNLDSMTIPMKKWLGKLQGQNMVIGNFIRRKRYC